MASANNLQYPVGKFAQDTSVTAEKRRVWIRQIADAPAAVGAAVAGLSEAELDMPYRPGGWTVRQVVHHVADSHLNAYTRFRLALTEGTPTIKPYDQDAWSALSDARSAPVSLSLRLIEALHARWVLLLQSMEDGQFKRSINHPESGIQTLDWLLQMYAWHCRHHTAHITEFRRRLLAIDRVGP